MDQAPVMPSDPGGVTPTAWRTASTRLLGTCTKPAGMAASFSHQPESVKVWVVSCPSTSRVRVNWAPISGVTPKRSSTWVSAAAWSVPSWGRAPVVGVA